MHRPITILRKRMNTKSERAKVSSELKAAVKSVREAYKAAKSNEEFYQMILSKMAEL